LLLERGEVGDVLRSTRGALVALEILAAEKEGPGPGSGAEMRLTAAVAER
jgi:hypothetical protein